MGKEYKKFRKVGKNYTDFWSSHLERNMTYQKIRKLSKEGRQKFTKIFIATLFTTVGYDNVLIQL